MLIINRKFLILLLYISGIFLTCKGIKEDDDFHSSVTALQEVLIAEKSLVESLASYIARSEEKIDLIKSFFNELRDEHLKVVQNGLFSKSMENPLQLFLLKKRLSVDVHNLQQYLNTTTMKIFEKFKKASEQHNLPSAEDLEGITLGLLRIQEVYEVSAEQIADGMIKDIDFGRILTASDCFEIGSKLKDLNCHYYAIQWFKVALKRIEEEELKGITPKIEKNLVFDSLAYSQFMEGSVKNAKAAVETALFALENNYTSLNAINIASSFKSYLENYTALKNGIKQSTEYHPPLGGLSRHDLTELDLLKRSCRGELKKSAEEERKLFCRYERKNHLFLLIAPIKIEVLNLDPLLIVFYDVIYDSEVETLKELSTEKLVRAQVWNAKEGMGEPSRVRTSKFTRFDNQTHTVFSTLNQRIEDMTGLTMETAENFQIVNYGIGGHYDIHADFFIEPDEESGVKPYGHHENGNRIATVLFYMSDVLHGGGTAWPYINVLTLPKKGSAVLWYNLHADGQPNYKSRHSACPVIVGSKWIINKWVRIRGQEFRKPCLSYPDSGVARR